MNVNNNNNNNEREKKICGKKTNDGFAQVVETKSASKWTTGQ